MTPLRYIRRAAFRFRYWIKPNSSTKLDKKLFVSWLNLIPDNHEFSMCFDNDPISQFINCTTRTIHLAVGLDWYSFEEPIVSKPLTECHALPSWASSIMWDKNLGSNFTKLILLKYHPILETVAAS